MRLVKNAENTNNSTNTTSKLLYELANSNLIQGINSVGEGVRSAIVNGIDATGDYLVNTTLIRAINTINPIVVGSQLLDESINSFANGNIASGTGAAGLAILSMIPGEAFAATTFKNTLPYASGLLRNGLFSKKAFFSGGEKLPNFACNDLLENHFTKHGAEFNNAFQNAEEYLSGAQDVIKNAIKVTYEYKGEMRAGYVQFMGTTEGKSIIEQIRNPGVAKFEFVGTNSAGHITTYFTPSGKNIWNIVNNNPLNKNIIPYELMELNNGYFREAKL